MIMPRSVVRTFLIASLLLGLVLLLNITKTSIDDGTWDASSYGDRRLPLPMSFGEVRRRVGSWTNLGPNEQRPISGGGKSPVHKEEEEQVDTWSNPIVDSTRWRNTPRPPSAPWNTNLTSRIPHQGHSRVIRLDTDPEEYDLGDLPTLEEAFANLSPKMIEVKEKIPAIPREHELTQPIFPPFLTTEQEDRFWHLREEWDEEKNQWVKSGKRRYLMVTICRQVAGMLADWFAAWTVLADFLGPETLVFSLLEGDSADGSGEILSQVMRSHLLFIGVPPENIHIRTHLPPIDWENNHRIQLLAEMRNAGMKPLYDSLPSGLTPDGNPWTAVIFYNDVYLSAAHFLELLHQHFKQDADVTCGWDHAGRWFYDGWVGRDMSGDLYTPFPVKEEDKDLPQKLFLSSPETKTRFDLLLPFQVFSGWNGIAVLNPTPFLPPYNVRFRRGKPKSMFSNELECQWSESAFISWDFWKYGFGRVQVVPGVHACYGKEDAMMRGWLEWPNPTKQHPEEIDWDDEPPKKIRCHDWPDKNGKGYWAWDTVRWTDSPKPERPQG
ncbi:hypothetical protein TREMEDRAFT_62182 [Tremella mesenterica DSM 1558]|nr:uncharacterized protein TREMEDRAFT_62182 [Tremella mesenterica DSM 1558]EIW69318.1 hypothetical protein TREMEDRAFT_62182 [Tremella mesenterica DSM 1558]